MDRLEFLERQVEHLTRIVDSIPPPAAELSPRPQIRIAKTKAQAAVAYPTDGNTFPIVFVDGVFTEDQGDQAVTWEDRQANAEHFVHDVSDQFIAENTYLTVFRWKNRWWTKAAEAPRVTACFGTFAVGSCSGTPTLATLEMMDGSSAPAVGAVTVNNRCGLASRNGDSFLGHVRWNEDPVVVEISEVTNRTVTLDRVIYDAPDLKVQTVTLTGQYCVNPVETTLVTLTGQESFCYGTFTQGSCGGATVIIESLTMLDGSASPTLGTLVINNRCNMQGRDYDAFIGHVNWNADPVELEIVQVYHRNLETNRVYWDAASHTLKESKTTISVPYCEEPTLANILSLSQKSMVTGINWSLPYLQSTKENVWIVDPSLGTGDQITFGECST